MLVEVYMSVQTDNDVLVLRNIEFEATIGIVDSRQISAGRIGQCSLS